MIKLNGHTITPTIFPDRTSQVWKIPSDVFSLAKKDVVTWEFDNEAELIQVCQLGDLLNREAKLVMPFLPYGRQDKEITNDSAFALGTAMEILMVFFPEMETLDAHSTFWLPPSCKSIYPAAHIKHAIEATGCDTVCFPDKGVAQRYRVPLRTIVLDKRRDQSTGDILGLEISSGKVHSGSNILIIDDICDGGRTFIEAAKLLYGEDADQVHLYTTHGIYSKGIQVLKDANIARIFNRKGEV